jgi:hypothetical protein
MNLADRGFTGSIPQLYEHYLVPLIFPTPKTWRPAPRRCGPRGCWRAPPALAR